MRHRGLRCSTAAWGTLALGILIPSCMAPPRPDPTRFYILAARVHDHPPAPGSPVVGLGPLTLPGYLLRPMLATRVDDTQVRYSDFDRWAEPLPTLFGRVLGQDLSALLGARVVPYPWYRDSPLDVVVRVDVASFEPDAAGHARLGACWTVRDAPTRAICRDECASIVERADEGGMQPRVTALSRAVGDLAERLASAIGSCPRTLPNEVRRGGTEK